MHAASAAAWPSMHACAPHLAPPLTRWRRPRVLLGLGLACAAGKGRSAAFGGNARFWLAVFGSLAVVSVLVLMGRGGKRAAAGGRGSGKRARPAAAAPRAAGSTPESVPECMLCGLATSVRAAAAGNKDMTMTAIKQAKGFAGIAGHCDLIMSKGAQGRVLQEASAVKAVCEVQHAALSDEGLWGCRN
jgi:hypothetical protein